MNENCHKDGNKRDETNCQFTQMSEMISTKNTSLKHLTKNLSYDIYVVPVERLFSKKNVHVIKVYCLMKVLKF
jgi:hypothetical protein